MPATICSPAPPASATTGYVPIAASVLGCLDTTSLDVYFWNDRHAKVVLFRGAHLALSHDRAEELWRQCGEMLYVRSSDFAELCGEILASLEKVMAMETLSPTQRYEVLQTTVSVEIEKSLRAIEPGQYLSLVQRVGEQIRLLMSDQSVLPSDLFGIARHDSHTFTHVTNVASYAVVLAEQLGIDDRDELDQIAAGAMLHDMGKRFIPSSILTKPGGLSEEERAIIQTHPQLGYEELCRRGDVNHAQLMMVYQHHEHVDGSGYPVRITGDEIHPWAKLLAVVDVFDALTGKRPYRRPMTLREAAGFLADRSGAQFDSEIVTCWISAIEAR